MAFKTASNNGFIVKAYQGDNKTLLAFNFANKGQAQNLAGFSILCKPPGQTAYYLWNELLFPTPNQHATVAGEPPRSSANSPFQKYRWTHVPGSNHQGTAPATGNYTYTITPRYFDANSNMLKLDGSKSVQVTVDVGPFQKGVLTLGFTRGYMQSEAYEGHFGAKTPVQPKGRALQFNTNTTAGTNKQGQSCTFIQIYEWMGASARVQVFDVLQEVQNDRSLTLKMFAYDLNEPDIVTILFQLADEGRIRLILDNATLHITHKDPRTGKIVTPLEVPFAAQFAQKAPSAILRGHFGRYAHDKVLIVLKDGNPVKVLTGSTNFSVTGIYVNANHVLVFDDPEIAKEYSAVFDESWNDKCSESAFAKSSFATAPYKPQISGLLKTTINFSPHQTGYVTSLLGALVKRIKQEAKTHNGSVLFAVMQLTGGKNQVYDALNTIHSSPFFSYGISDSPAGTRLYQPATPNGVLVTGKPKQVSLPPPFDQLPIPPGHEIHDKFVICGLNGPDPVVYAGSSNLADGGERVNGDNLLEIHDADVATAFAIEALLLVDHYNFLDRYSQSRSKSSTGKKAPAKGSAKAGKKVPKKAPARKTTTKKKAASGTHAGKSAAKNPR